MMTSDKGRWLRRLPMIRFYHPESGTGPRGKAF